MSMTQKSLGLALRGRREAWGAAAILTIYYVLSMSRDLSFFDSAELAMVAAQGGLGHPTGQPLHTILGFLMAHLPGVSALVGINLLSALPTALTVIPICSLAEGLVGAPLERGGRVLLAGVAGLLLVHPVFWENGSRVEVYALGLFFAVWATARMTDALKNSEGFRGWLAAGIGFGLAASANPFVALMVVVPAAPALLVALARKRLSGRGVGGALVGGVLGLLPYLYIPLMAGRDAFVWGAPLRGPALWGYLTASDFSHNQGIEAALWAQHIWTWLGWAATHDLLPIAAVGVAAWAVTRRSLGRFMALGALSLTILWLTYNIIFNPNNPDYLGYLATPMALLVAGCAAAAARLWSQRPSIAVGLSLVLVGTALVSHPAVWTRTRHRDVLARTLAEGALAAAPKNGVLMVESDHWVFPLLYLQEVEHQRPDVVVWATGLSGTGWWWVRLLQRHPDLVRPPPRREPWVLQGRRFLTANPELIPEYEGWRLAVLLGRPGCAGPWLLKDARACIGEPVFGQEALAPAVAASVARLGAGSPSSDRVAAQVSMERGENLWRMGASGPALTAFRSGVPTELLPPIPAAFDAESVGRLDVPPLTWAKQVMIGDPSHNLYLAGLLLWYSNARETAAAHIHVAAQMGLAEALRGIE